MPRHVRGGRRADGDVPVTVHDWKNGRVNPLDLRCSRCGATAWPTSSHAGRSPLALTKRDVNDAYAEWLTWSPKTAERDYDHVMAPDTCEETQGVMAVVEVMRS